MKSRYSLRAGLAALALMLGLAWGGPAVWGQTRAACMDDCLEELAICINLTGGSQQCEDDYDACIEMCTIIYPQAERINQ